MVFLLGLILTNQKPTQTLSQDYSDLCRSWMICSKQSYYLEERTELNHVLRRVAQFSTSAALSSVCLSLLTIRAPPFPFMSRISSDWTPRPEWVGNPVWLKPATTTPCQVSCHLTFKCHEMRCSIYTASPKKTVGMEKKGSYILIFGWTSFGFDYNRHLLWQCLLH